MKHDKAKLSAFGILGMVNIPAIWILGMIYDIGLMVGEWDFIAGFLGLAVYSNYPLFRNQLKQDSTFPSNIWTIWIYMGLFLGCGITCNQAIVRCSHSIQCKSNPAYKN